MLIALWDGEPARSVGSTAEIVELARRRDLPLVWIRPSASEGFQVSDEWLVRLRLVPGGASKGDATMYEPQPIDTDRVVLPPHLGWSKSSQPTREVWARERLAQGWTFGERRGLRARRQLEPSPAIPVRQPPLLATAEPGSGL